MSNYHLSFVECSDTSPTRKSEPAKIDIYIEKVREALYQREHLHQYVNIVHAHAQSPEHHGCGDWACEHFLVSLVQHIWIYERYVSNIRFTITREDAFLIFYQKNISVGRHNRALYLLITLSPLMISERKFCNLPSMNMSSYWVHQLSPIIKQLCGAYTLK